MTDSAPVQPGRQVVHGPGSDPVPPISTPASSVPGIETGRSTTDAASDPATAVASPSGTLPPAASLPLPAAPSADGAVEVEQISKSEIIRQKELELHDQFSVLVIDDIEYDEITRVLLEGHRDRIHSIMDRMSAAAAELIGTDTGSLIIRSYVETVEGGSMNGATDSAVIMAQSAARCLAAIAEHATGRFLIQRCDGMIERLLAKVCYPGVSDVLEYLISDPRINLSVANAYSRLQSFNIDGLILAGEIAARLVGPLLTQAAAGDRMALTALEHLLLRNLKPDWQNSEKSTIIDSIKATLSDRTGGKSCTSVICNLFEDDSEFAHFLLECLVSDAQMVTAFAGAFASLHNNRQNVSIRPYTVSLFGPLISLGTEAANQAIEFLNPAETGWLGIKELTTLAESHSSLAACAGQILSDISEEDERLLISHIDKSIVEELVEVASGLGARIHWLDVDQGVLMRLLANPEQKAQLIVYHLLVWRAESETAIKTLNSLASYDKTAPILASAFATLLSEGGWKTESMELNTIKELITLAESHGVSKERRDFFISKLTDTKLLKRQLQLAAKRPGAITDVLYTLQRYIPRESFLRYIPCVVTTLSQNSPYTDKALRLLSQLLRVPLAQSGKYSKGIEERFRALIHQRMKDATNVLVATYCFGGVSQLVRLAKEGKGSQRSDAAEALAELLEGLYRLDDGMQFDSIFREIGKIKDGTIKQRWLFRDPDALTEAASNGGGISTLIKRAVVEAGGIGAAGELLKSITPTPRRNAICVLMRLLDELVSRVRSVQGSVQGAEREEATRLLRTLAREALLERDIDNPPSSIQALIDLTSSDVESKKYLGVDVLHRLSLESVNAIMISKLGGVPCLLGLLDSDKCRELALTTLANLLRSDVGDEGVRVVLDKAMPTGTLRVRDHIVMGDGIRRLVDCLETRSDAERRMVALAIGRLATDARNVTAIAQSGCLPLLVDMVSNEGDEEGQYYAGHALANLASNESNRKQIANLRGVTSFISLLQSERNVMKGLAIFALHKLALDGSVRAQILEGGGLNALRLLIQSGAGGELVERTVALLERGPEALTTTNGGMPGRKVTKKDHILPHLFDSETPMDWVRTYAMK